MAMLRAIGLTLSLLFAQAIEAEHSVEPHHDESDCQVCALLLCVDSLLPEPPTVVPTSFVDEAQAWVLLDRVRSASRRNGHPSRGPPQRP